MVEGDINLLGLLGLEPRGAQRLLRHPRQLQIRGDASPEKLAAIVEQSRARSAVFDVLTNGCPVSIEIDAG